MKVSAWMNAKTKRGAVGMKVSAWMNEKTKRGAVGMKVSAWMNEKTKRGAVGMKVSAWMTEKTKRGVAGMSPTSESCEPPWPGPIAGHRFFHYLAFSARTAPKRGRICTPPLPPQPWSPSCATASKAPTLPLFGVSSPYAPEMRKNLHPSPHSTPSCTT